MTRWVILISDPACRMSAGLGVVALLVMTELSCLAVGRYEASWERGENSLTWMEAKQFCASRGKQMLSLDTSQVSQPIIAADTLIKLPVSSFR